MSFHIINSYSNKDPFINGEINRIEIMIIAISIRHLKLEVVV